MPRHATKTSFSSHPPNEFGIIGDLAILFWRNRKGAPFEIIIDAEDVTLARQWKWSVNSDGYAVRNGESSSLVNPRFLHRFIVGAKAGQFVDHINRDPRDNRKSNLRIVSESLNCRNKRSSNIRFDGRRGGHWQVVLTEKKVSRSFGYFKAKDEALKIAESLRAKWLAGVPLSEMG